MTSTFGERTTPHDCIVIGAGMAGLTCSNLLQKAGMDVLVLEKSRAHGGRMSTRVVADEGLTFDHGAQYVRGRSPEFLAMVEMLKQEGSVAPWTPDGGQDFNADGVIVGQPLMRDFMAPVANALTIHFNVQVERAERWGGLWHLTTDKGSVAAKHVISTVPSPQAARLFADHDLGLLDDVVMAPCWALMAAFDHPLKSHFDCRRHASDALGWVARNSTKPGRSDTETWVAHARPEWSETHLEMSREEIAPLLLVELTKALDLDELPNPRWVRAHRWRYAQTIKPLDQDYLTRADGTLLIGGDWCIGARVEAAFTSGAAMVNALLGKDG